MSWLRGLRLLKNGSLLKNSNRCMAEARKIAFGQVEKFNIDSATISIPVNNEIECVDVPALWLRWNCECPKCKQASSGQKTLETKKLVKKTGIDKCVD